MSSEVGGSRGGREGSCECVTSLIIVIWEDEDKERKLIEGAVF